MREDVKKKILPSPLGGDVSVVTYIQTHLIPMREDVKKKILPSPLGGDVSVVTYIQTHLILRGVIGFVALARRTFQRQRQPQLLVPT